MSRTQRAAAMLAALLTWIPAAGAAAFEWDGSEPAPGIYFYWYEPSFYAGFAPRTQDPSRPHIELSRGNQVRFTVVLGDREIDDYLDDLLLRQKTYQELIDKKVITLTTNKNFERFNERLDELGVASIVAQRSALGPEAYRAKSLEVMKKLNPQRIFEIRIPASKLVADWHAFLTKQSPDAANSTAGKLDAANAILPGRVDLYQLDPALETSLARARELAGAGGPEASEFRQQALAFLEQATGGHYAAQGDTVEAVEFTEIMPAGTIDAFTDTPYGKLPEFGATGVWPLIVRAQGRGSTGMVDYLSLNPGYGFIPLLGYQHAGGIYYNAFHNAGIRTPVGTPYLPRQWQSVAGDRDPSKSYKQLWLVSRGPASHGCTRLDSGQMSELRNSLPSSSEAMAGIPTYRNLPYCYEVFDIDGNGSPEVMGVQYYVAYKSVDHKPVKANAPNTRKPYYEWLYGSNIRYEQDGSAVIEKVPTCRFVGKRKAEEAVTYRDVPLYEAPFEPSPIQFYKINKASFESAAGFDFNRELRKVGVGHKADRRKLLLD